MMPIKKCIGALSATRDVFMELTGARVTRASYEQLSNAMHRCGCVFDLYPCFIEPYVRHVTFDIKSLTDFVNDIINTCSKREGVSSQIAHHMAFDFSLIYTFGCHWSHYPIIYFQTSGPLLYDFSEYILNFHKTGLIKLTAEDVERLDVLFNRCENESKNN